MIVITEEMIRKLQQRVDVSYEKAEKLLRRARGNVDRAVFLYNKKQNSNWDKMINGLKRGFENLIKYRFIMTRKGNTLINLPLIIILVFIIIEGITDLLFSLILAFIIALIAECEVKVLKEKPNDKSNTVTKKNVKTTYRDKNRENSNEGIVYEVKETEENKEVVEIVGEEDYNKAEDNKKEEISKKDNDDDDYYEIVIED